MDESTVTMIGRDEAWRSIETLPVHVTAALRAVAQSTAQRVLANARANLAARTHGDGTTAAALAITEDAANQIFHVGVVGLRTRPANLPLWLEYGFISHGVHHPGLYIMHDAAAAEDAQHTAESEAAAVGVVQDALG
jgi:hypothetical protein